MKTNSGAYDLCAGLMALFIIALPTLAHALDTPPPHEEGVVTVPEGSRAFLKTDMVRPGNDVALLRLPARVAFRDGAFSQLGPPFAGRVVRVHCRTGDHVNKGDPLVSIQSPEAASARTGLAQATAAVREAHATMEREMRMHAQGIGIERERLAAEIQLTAAEAQLASAKAAAEFAGTGRAGTVVVRAPLAGTVVHLNATVGAAVAPGGDALVEVGDASNLWVVADLFERDLPLVRPGQRVEAHIGSVGHAIAGRVASVGTVVSTDLRTTPVRILVEGDAESLRPGMFGRVQVYADEEQLSVPSRAVLFRRNGASVVYVARRDGAFERRTIAVGQSIDGRVRVLGGLNVGEEVVTEGALLIDNASDQLL